MSMERGKAGMASGAGGCAPYAHGARSSICVDAWWAAATAAPNGAAAGPAPLYCTYRAGNERQKGGYTDKNLSTGISALI